MTSREYWAKREEDALRHYAAQEKDYDKEINRVYQSMLDQIQRDIDSFYQRYATAEGITMAEARRRVASADIEAYERRAARYVRERNFSDKANAEMRLYNTMMRVNRLELLKAQIAMELLAGTEELDQYLEEILRGRTLEELERQAGILGKSVPDSGAAADTIVHASFHNASWSERIWRNQAQLRGTLNRLLQSGLIRGVNSRELARQLRREFDVSRYQAERLMRTELARVQTAAQKAEFEENDVTMYEFMANRNCCDACQALDGKHFQVADMEPGLNAAPVHPNCRCAVAPWEDDEEYEAWLDYLSKGGTTAQWEAHGKAKWLKNKNQGFAKAGDRDIITSGAVSGARNPYGKKAQEHADKYYNLVRSMKTDVQKIAKTTGYSEKEIQAVKNYIFVEEHDLGDSGIRRFDPDYMMAESWQRLIEGRPEPHDLTMIHHEIMERRLVRDGMSQDKAHIKASAKYNYSKEAEEFYGKIEKFKNE